ncbi:MAG TPA: nuclear transport factor 2 family protein [Pseudonocardiaceae bacterium]
MSYHYLDIADVDGYGSLFDVDAILQPPGMSPVRGRRQIERFQQLRIGVGGGNHEVAHVFGSGGRITAVGRYSTVDEDGREGCVEFADLFTINPNGLIASQKTYLYLAADPIS